MKYSFKAWFYGHFYHSTCRKELKKRGVSERAIKKIVYEHKTITLRARAMNDERMLSSYICGIYFVAMNRATGLSAEENYSILERSLANSPMFRKGLGRAEDYLDEQKLPDRMQWAEESHKRTDENNWVVDVLSGCEEYDLGYNYHECGVCKLCQDEGCFELARYLCRLDYMMADIMGARLVRTKTIADGDEMCDFRYSLK